MPTNNLEQDILIQMLRGGQPPTPPPFWDEPAAPKDPAFNMGFAPNEKEQERINKALALLQEEERPTVPIRVMDPDPKQFFIFKSHPNTDAIAHRKGDTKILFLNRKSPTFTNDLQLLASKLAHEQRHFTDPDDVVDERAGYERELAVLERLGYRNRAYLDALRQRLANKDK